MPIQLFSVQISAHRPCRSQRGKKSDNCHYAENHRDIANADCNRIGVDYKVARIGTQPDKPEMLLQYAQDDSDCQSGNGADYRYQPSLRHKYLFHHTVVGAKAVKRTDALVFLKYEDGERADDVERRNNKDERQQQQRNPFLNVDHLQRLTVLH